eukprot:5258249-Amphidinium_carterae.1
MESAIGLEVRQTSFPLSPPKWQDKAVDNNSNFNNMCVFFTPRAILYHVPHHQVSTPRITPTPPSNKQRSELKCTTVAVSRSILRPPALLLQPPGFSHGTNGCH